MKFSLIPRLLALAALLTVSLAREKIVGGQPAPQGRYPWIAGLFLSTSGSFPNCGGTLIAPSVVLSAGHCSGMRRAKVGCYLVSDNCQSFTITQEILHPSFVGNPVPVHDFIIFKLSGSSSIAPVPFVANAGYANSFSSGFVLTTAGWGTTSSGGSQPSVLMEVDINYIDNDTCNTKYNAAGEGSLIKASMMCAAAAGKDSCQGDSGGPLLARCDDASKDVLVGVVSWGIGCADPQYPGVYARISDGISFISQYATLATPPPLATHCSGSPTAPSLPPVSVPPVPSPVASPVASPVTPGVPPQWVCNPNYFNAADGCDCQCGFADPDCSLQGQTVYNCLPGEGCVNDVCIPTGTNSPTKDPTAFPTPFPVGGVPPEWHCNTAYYDGGAGDGCDCNCGAPDPDCLLPSQDLYNCNPGQVCVDGVCSGVPSDWHCTASWYGSLDGCDCGCGAPDPDCDVPSQTLYHCTGAQVCIDGVCSAPVLGRKPGVSGFKTEPTIKYMRPKKGPMFKPGLNLP